MITIRRYDPATDREVWDAFVADSRNATFLFYRAYMDYHSDRFDDYSLMAYDGRGRLLALLPACRSGSTLYSHQGLTFGGWLLPHRRCDALDMLAIFDAFPHAMREVGVRRLIYKAIPYIYSRQPAQEDIYAMVRNGGCISASLVSSVIDLSDPIPFDMGSRQRARKALASGIVIGESDRWEEYWTILTNLLRERFNERLDELDAAIDTAADALDNVFKFVEEAFGEGQEMLMLVTDLSVSRAGMAFINDHGCDRYFAHNQNLQFYERGHDLAARIDRITLEEE